MEVYRLATPAQKASMDVRKLIARLTKNRE